MMAMIDEDKEIYHNGRTYAEHCAWLDSLVGDEYRIVHMPIGHLFNLAIVSGFKRILLTQQTTAGERMKLLDGIAQCVFGCVTPEAVAAIEPCCETGEKILLEIFSLPFGEQTQTFSKGDVFRLLANLKTKDGLPVDGAPPMRWHKRPAIYSGTKSIALDAFFEIVTNFWLGELERLKFNKP